MRKSGIAVLCVAFGLAGCFDLTPQQQINLQNELALGKLVVQATANLYCVWEPTTTTLIGIFDQSQGTSAMITKIDAATKVICAKALGGGQ